MRRLTAAVTTVCLVAMVALTAAEGKTYGKGVKLTAATPIEKLLAAPKDFVGKTVRVDGVVTAVCDKAGCWMDLRDEKADPATARTLRMKVNDGEITFPVTAKGKKASIEGVFEPVGESMAKEYAADAKEAKVGSEMKTPPPTHQLKGTGAVIY
jgi:hypothetical protein